VWRGAFEAEVHAASARARLAGAAAEDAPVTGAAAAATYSPEFLAQVSMLCLARCRRSRPTWRSRTADRLQTLLHS